MDEPTCTCPKCRFDFYTARIKTLHAELTFSEVRARQAAQEIVADPKIEDEQKKPAQNFLDAHKHLERAVEEPPKAGDE